MSTAYQTLLQEFVPRPIASARAYQRAMKQIDRLFRKAERSRAEDDLLELLAMLVEQYEIRQGYAVPVLSPRDRLAGFFGVPAEEFIGAVPVETSPGDER